jgi:hypothetical protein
MTPAAPATTAAARQQNARLARAKATQQARRAGQISSENYTYVPKDLRLVGAVALGAAIILGVMDIVLAHNPSFLLFGH